MDCNTPGFPVLHHLPEPAQTHVHWVGNAIQPSHPLSTSHISEEEQPGTILMNLEGTWLKSKVIQWIKGIMGIKNLLYMVFVTVLHLL